MTTSGAISSTLTVREVVEQALVDRTAIFSPGETIDPESMTLGIRVLNLMLKSWQADGCNLWRELEDTVSATTAQTTLDPRVIDVLEARLTRSGIDRPLTRWEWGEYVGLPNKAATGTPSIYVFRRGRDSVSLMLWPVPSEAMTISHTAARVIEDVTQEDETLDVPQEWLEAVVCGLAVRLWPSFNANNTTPPAVLVAMADQLYAQMRDLDRPASYFMGA
jgi:hypothetical protein